MTTSFKKQFGARIKYLRKLAGITQETLAERAGLSTKTISYIENGKNTLSFNKLPLLADAFGVPVYKLFVFSLDDVSRPETLNNLLSSANEKELNCITDIVKTVLSLN